MLSAFHKTANQELAAPTTLTSYHLPRELKPGMSVPNRKARASQSIQDGHKIGRVLKPYTCFNGRHPRSPL